MELRNLSRSRAVQIGSGGYANVYRVPGLRIPDVDFELAFKRYKRAALPISALAMQSIVNVRHSLPEAQRGKLDEIATWPLEVVVSGAETRGILMRLIPDHFFFDQRQYEGGPKRTILEAKYLLQEQDFCRTWGVPYLDTDARIAFLGNAAYSLAFLHRLKVVYGDLSANNVICGTGTGERAAMLVDCDAVLLAGTSPVFGDQPHSPGYEPPEAMHAEAERRRLAANGSADLSHSHQLASLKKTWARQTYETDVFKFGLLVLRVLDHGRQKSTNRDPRQAARLLPRSLRDLLLESLSESPGARPNMRAWAKALGPDSTPRGNGGSALAVGETVGNFRKRADGSWTRVR